MKKTIKNRLNYKDYIFIYVISYPLAVGTFGQIIFSPIHLDWVMLTIVLLPLRVIHRENIWNTWDAKGVGIRIWVKHIPIFIILWIARTICSMGGINTELIFGW